jgi:hypothetical protein
MASTSTAPSLIGAVEPAISNTPVGSHAREVPDSRSVEARLIWRCPKLEDGPDQLSSRRRDSPAQRCPLWRSGQVTGRFVACLVFFSVRFSFNDLPDFLDWCWRGDLSATSVCSSFGGWFGDGSSVRRSVVVGGRFLGRAVLDVFDVTPRPLARTGSMLETRGEQMLVATNSRFSHPGRGQADGPGCRPSAVLRARPCRTAYRSGSARTPPTASRRAAPRRCRSCRP